MYAPSLFLLVQTFNLLVMSPENVNIPLLLFDKLTKKYYQEEWTLKYDEIANCTVLMVARAECPQRGQSSQTISPSNAKDCDALSYRYRFTHAIENSNT